MATALTPVSIATVAAATGVPVTDEGDGAYMARVEASKRRWALTGVQPVTVVNLNDFPIMVNGALFIGLEVPACPAGQRYAAKVIEDVRVERIKGLERREDAPAEFAPIQLAQEFVDRYASKGGVFLVRGDLRDAKLELTPEFKMAYAAAHAQVIQHARDLVKQGFNYYNTLNHKDAKNIDANPQIRKSAHRLIAMGELDPEKVPWLYDSAVDTVKSACPACKADLKAEQPYCRDCGEVVDVKAWYKLGKLTETDIVLERLTRKEVQELGISDYVAETADERPARLARGVAKPLSAFERKQREVAKPGQSDQRRAG